MKCAFICGITGQDGSYLAKSLIDKGYRVVGSSRNAHMQSRTNLERLGIDRNVELVSMAANDFRSVLQVLVRIDPDDVYNLAGQSSVSLSFEQPVETLESITTGTVNILEGIRFHNPGIRFYNAGSSECFGDTGAEPASNMTPFRPLSPYAVAKACATNMVASYRKAYGMFACTGIAFNHESPLRPPHFVTRKIANAAFAIRSGRAARLTLGNLNIARDWGWAPDYVEAMWLMLQRDSPDDFVLATGRTTTLKRLVHHAFEFFDLDWEKYVHVDPLLLRPSDIEYSAADTARTARELGWRAKYTVEDVMRKMCEYAASQMDE